MQKANGYYIKADELGLWQLKETILSHTSNAKTLLAASQEPKANAAKSFSFTVANKRWVAERNTDPKHREYRVNSDS